MSIQIKEVKTRRELREFVNFPERLYKDNKCYVPPLVFDQMNTLDQKKGAAQAAAPAEQADGSATQVAAPAEQATATAAPVEQATAAATQVATPVEQVTAAAPAGQAAACAAQATAPARQD